MIESSSNCDVNEKKNRYEINIIEISRFILLSKYKIIIGTLIAFLFGVLYAKKYPTYNSKLTMAPVFLDNQFYEINNFGVMLNHPAFYGPFLSSINSKLQRVTQLSSFALRKNVYFTESKDYPKTVILNTRLPVKMDKEYQIFFLNAFHDALIKYNQNFIPKNVNYNENNDKYFYKIEIINNFLSLNKMIQHDISKLENEAGQKAMNNFSPDEAENLIQNASKYSDLIIKFQSFKSDLSHIFLKNIKFCINSSDVLDTKDTKKEILSILAFSLAGFFLSLSLCLYLSLGKKR